DGGKVAEVLAVGADLGAGPVGIAEQHLAWDERRPRDPPRRATIAGRLSRNRGVKQQSRKERQAEARRRAHGILRELRTDLPRPSYCQPEVRGYFCLAQNSERFSASAQNLYYVGDNQPLRTALVGSSPLTATL